MQQQQQQQQEPVHARINSRQRQQQLQGSSGGLKAGTPHPPPSQQRLQPQHHSNGPPETTTVRPRPPAAVATQSTRLARSAAATVAAAAAAVPPAAAGKGALAGSRALLKAVPAAGCGMAAPATPSAGVRAAAAPAAAVASATVVTAQPQSLAKQQGAQPAGAKLGDDGALLQAELLGHQDAAGFTPLMCLVQRGLVSDAQGLLARGDCCVNACTTSTGDTALHMLLSSPKPDLQLAAALVAAGADVGSQRRLDGSTPLLLACKLGGQAGLDVARALLLQAASHGGRRYTPGAAGSSSSSSRTPGSSLWCSLGDDMTPSAAKASTPGTASSSSSSSSHTANAAGETPLSVAVAAVMASTQTGCCSSGVPAAPAQQLLVLVLQHSPALPQPLAAALLHRGLAGQLSDELTAQVVACLPDISAVEAAAAVAAGAAFTAPADGSPQAAAPRPSVLAAGGVPHHGQLSSEGLLAAKMYKTAVAFMAKCGSGLDADADGNTLLHSAVSGAEDLPRFVEAVLEAGVPVDAVNSLGDSALYVAARQGHEEACRVLLAAGADVLRRNGKNRTPGGQLRLPEGTKALLQQTEEAARAEKEEQRHVLWDGKMRATQTQSAYGIRVT